MNEEAKTNPVADGEQPLLKVENIFVKGVSLEIGEGIVVPTFQKAPHVNLEIRNTLRPLSEEGTTEVALEITARIEEEGKTVILVEVIQTGIFNISNAGANERQLLLNIAAPEMLYPYACQTISDLMSKAAMPRIFLPPVNFKDIYRQKTELLKKEGGAEA